MPREDFVLNFRAQGLDRLNRQLTGIDRQGQRANRTLALFRQALVVASTARLAAGLVNVADGFRNLQNRLNVITGDLDNTNQLLEVLRRVANETLSPLEDTTILFTRLAQNAGRLGLTYGQLANVTRNLNSLVRLSGAEAISASNAIRQFTQALGEGSLRGDELRSVVEQLPRLAQEIAKDFPEAGGALISFAKEIDGLPIDETLRRLAERIPEIEEQLARLQPTIRTSFQVLQNNFEVFLGRVLDTTGGLNLLSRGILAVSDNLAELAAALAVIGAVVGFNLLVAGVGALGRALLTTVSIITGPFRSALSIFLSLTSVIVGTTTALTRFIAVGAAGGAFAGLTGGLRALGGAAVAVAGTLRGSFIAAVGAAQVAALGFRGVLLASQVAVVGLFQGLRRLLPILARFVLVIGGIPALILGVVAGVVLLQERFNFLGRAVDNVAAFIVASFDTLRQQFTLLPRALGEAIIGAVNIAIRGVSRLVNFVIDGLNRIPGLAIENIRAPVIENAFAGSGQQLANTFLTNFQAALDAEGGPTGALRDRFQQLIEGFRNILSGPEINQDLLGQIPPGEIPDRIEGISDEVRKLREELAGIADSVSPLAAFNRELENTNRIIKELGEAQVEEIAGFGSDELRRRVIRDLVGVGNAATDYAETLQTLQTALDRTAISQDEFSRAARDARIEFLDSQTSAEAGFERFFAKAVRDAEDAASQIERALGTAFSAAEDAIRQFARTGELSIRSLADTINNVLIDLAIQGLRNELLRSFAGAASGPTNGREGLVGPVRPGGGILGFLSNFIGAGAQTGANFTVGPGTGPALNGVDNRLLALPVRDGEQVTVTPRSEAGSAGRAPVINQTIVTPDANSFRRSQGQLLADANRQAQRVSRRKF